MLQPLIATCEITFYRRLALVGVLTLLHPFCLFHADFILPFIGAQIVIIKTMAITKTMATINKIMVITNKTMATINKIMVIIKTMAIIKTMVTINKIMVIINNKRKVSEGLPCVKNVQLISLP